MSSSSNLVIAKLPGEFRPRKSEHLIRVGRDNDGGYLLDARNLQHADILVGLGINDDWSFEEDFLNRKKIPLYAFDASVSEKQFFTIFVKTAVFKFYEPAIPLRWLRVSRNFGKFFKGENRHFEYMVGMDMAPDYISLPTLFEKFLPANANRIFFKIDIEGSEYRILDDLVKFADRIEGLAIEFHDVDLHLERIRKFITAFPLHLCHTHCNNFRPVDRNGVPLVIELTFTSRPVADEFVEACPAPLDMANRADTPDFAIAFS